MPDFAVAAGGRHRGRGRAAQPVQGLSAFTEADAADFRGRQRWWLVCSMRCAAAGSEGRLVAAVGPSGSGKSSVVRSPGLLPELRRGAIDGSRRVVRHDDGARRASVRGARERAGARGGVRQPGPLAELMSGNDRGIARAVNQVIPDEGAELVLVIDQFEELFTLVADESERRRFIDGLIGAIREPRSRLRVVTTIRADFWDRPLRYPNLARRCSRPPPSP